LRMWVRGRAIDVLAANARWYGMVGVVADVLMWMRRSTGLLPDIGSPMKIWPPMGRPQQKVAPRPSRWIWVKMPDGRCVSYGMSPSKVGTASAAARARVENTMVVSPSSSPTIALMRMVSRRTTGGRPRRRARKGASVVGSVGLVGVGWRA
jgi:hypothetical protein